MSQVKIHFVKRDNGILGLGALGQYGFPAWQGVNVLNVLGVGQRFIRDHIQGQHILLFQEEKLFGIGQGFNPRIVDGVSSLSVRFPRKEDDREIVVTFFTQELLGLLDINLGRDAQLVIDGFPLVVLRGQH